MAVLACSLAGEWDTGVGRSRPIQPNSRILIENLLASNADQKNSTKCEFGKFTSMEKKYSATFDQMNLAFHYSTK
jgi:hypothetical protein